MFVLSGYSTYIRFRTAIANRDSEGAFQAARALPGQLSLVDALELVLLYGEELAAERRIDKGIRPTSEGKPFETCAARWVARVTVERDLVLPQLISAAQTLDAVGHGQGENAYRELASYLRG